MNPTLTIGPNQFSAFPFVGKDADGNVRPIHGTATISDYTLAYVAAFTANGAGIGIVPKTQCRPEDRSPCPQQVSAFSADGTALPPVQFDLVVTGPPLPPQAVALVPSAPVTMGPGNADFGPLPDPGSATVSF